MISYKKLYHGFIWLLFFGFLVLYFAQSTGYYEDVNNKKASLTKEKIEQFEKDVEKGKKIRVENYVINVKKNYNNLFSKFGLATSSIMANGFKKGLTTVFNTVDKMVGN